MFITPWHKRLPWRAAAAATAVVVALGAAACGARSMGGAEGAGGRPAADGRAAPGASTPSGAGGGSLKVGGRYVIDASRSSASYIAREKFVNRDLPSAAVGTTSDISGELVLADGGALVLRPSRVRVDLRTLKSDSPRRDSALRRRFLESERYPYAEFAIAGVEGAAPAIADGKPVRFKLAGRLKVREAERPVSFDVTGTVGGDMLEWTAQTRFKLSDFGIEPPDIANMLKVEDALQVEVKVIARRH